MAAPLRLHPPRLHTLRPQAARLAAGALCIAAFATAPLQAAPANPPTLATTGSAQDRAARPDQVLVRQRRNRTLASVSGKVVEASLRRVVVETRGGDTREFDSDEVQRVVLGDVPAQFTDARTYFERGDFENAAAQYRRAIEESDREVVRAAARFGATEALLMMGTVDTNRFGEAAEEAALFQSSFPESRHLPEVRLLEARAKRLSGDAAAAAEIYRAVFEEAGSDAPTRGYSLALCYGAGSSAAEAFLEAGDAGRAREMYASIGAALPTILTSVDDDDPARTALQTAEADARLGEGWALLVEGKGSRARAFFESQLSDAGPEASAALRFGARLGLAEALLAERELRAAQLEFAAVAALDFTERDRIAQSLTGLARCAIQLGGDDALQARAWLEAVREDYPDTPAGPQAVALLQTL